MKTSQLENELKLVKDGDLIHFEKKRDCLSLLFVFDEEEKDEIEEGDILEDDNIYEREHQDESQGLNGHLFRFEFLGVENLRIKGDPCDNYTIKNADVSENHIRLEIEGINLLEANHPVLLDFDFTGYRVLDEGVIEGADV